MLINEMGKLLAIAMLYLSEETKLCKVFSGLFVTLESMRITWSLW